MPPPFEIFWYFLDNSTCIGQIHSGGATTRYLDLVQGDPNNFSPGDHHIVEKRVNLRWWDWMLENLMEVSLDRTWGYLLESLTAMQWDFETE